MRRMANRLAVVGGCTLLLLTAPSVALAAKDESKPLVITQNTTLSADWYGEVIIGADWLTLDCAQHRIVGNGTGKGITLEGRTGVTVRQCEVQNFSTGIRVASTDRSMFEANAIHQIGTGIRGKGLAAVAGISVQSSHVNTFDGNAIYDVRGDGVDVFNASSNVFRANVVSDAGLAAWFIGNGADENSFERNEAHASGASGFMVADGASGNTFWENGAFANGWQGFDINGNMHPVSDNAFVSNTAQGNADNGFLLLNDAVGNTLLGNVSLENGNAGFLLASGPTGNTLTSNDGSANGVVGFAAWDYSSGNAFDSNVACGNAVIDAYQGSTSINTWTANTFCTAEGI